MSDDLIDRLAGDLKPVASSALSLRLVAALAIGAVVAAIVMVPWIGLRPDFPQAFADPVFWLKFGYALGLAVCGYVAVERLARPGGLDRRGLLAAIGLFAIVVAMGVTQALLSPPEDMRTLVLGSTALMCPFYVAALSLPVFVAVIVVMRQLAPTRLTLAGLAAGLLSGGVGAWVYSFHCGESGLPFLAIWYTLGVSIVAAVGAVTGRWLLRW
jgi:hypothetical protein